jgi:DNA ligase (NAD+)
MEKENGFFFGDSPTKNVGYKVKKSKKIKIFSREIPMLSLDNVNNKEAFIKFDERVKKILKKEEKVEYVCEWKIDGLSMSLIYKN